MSRMRVTVCLIAFLGLVALIPASMWAQAYSSSLTGLVTDPSGAAVPAVAAVAVTALLIAFGLDGGEALVVTLVVYPVFLVVASGSIARSQVRLLVSIVRNRKVAVEAATVDAP